MHKNIENESIQMAQPAGRRGETTAEFKADTSMLPVDDIPGVLIQEPMEVDMDPVRKIKDEKRYKQYYPLTHAQKRIYYDEIKYPGTSWANNAFLVRYKEKLNFDLLSRTLNFTIKKNDGLRLRVVEFDYEHDPLQYISPYKEISIDYKDFSGSDGERRLQEWLNRTTNKSFPLIDNDLFYFACIKFNETESGYYMNLHHLVSDGWTCFLVFMEINEIYESLEGGQPVDDTPNPSYIQYIIDEQAYLTSEKLKKDKEFWHKELIPLPEAVNLSSKKGNPYNIKADHLVLTVPGNLRTMIHEYRKTYKTSLYKLVLAGLSIYISRLTGLDDMIIGGANHSRSKDIYKRMAGMFVSTLSFRIFIDENMIFSRFVEKVGNDINFIVKNHEKYPFDILATELMETFGTDLRYLRNITLVGHDDVEMKRFDYEHVPHGSEPTAFIIHLNASNKDKDGILEIEYEYQVEQISKSDIRRIHQGLVNVLTDATISPGKKISEIELISKEEKKQILVDFNDTETKYPKDKNIPELFAIQVEKSPDKNAVVYKKEKLSYKKLNEKANRLGNYLCSGKHIQHNEPVGILMERSHETIVAIMGILKAGGVYVFIVPSLPVDRIKHMINDTGIAIIISQNKHIELLNKLQKECDVFRTYLCVDSQDISSLEKYNADKVDRYIKPENQAYVIYTSGTTGIPKGVVVGHRSLVNLCFWHNRYYDVTENDNASQYAAFSFDASVWEIFPYLVTGATLHIISDEIKLDVEKLGQYFEENNITISFLPTQFCELFMKRDNRSLRKLLTGGDKLRIFIRRGFKLYNNYGPTENTVVTTSFPVNNYLKNIPIGKPVDNNRIYILDKAGRHLQPIGVPGELCIGGESLALGYLNRPELTAEKFPENPFEPGERIYKTGDLVQWLPDGNIEYLGRIDQQVKIRGFRLEIGEIESKILKQQEQKIKDAVVIVREDNAGEKYLCGYILADENIDTTRLQTSLSKDLPDYMIPDYFVQIDDIPLTPSGKVNRKALPAPEVKDAAAKYVAPRNHIEEKLVEIWANLLGMKKDTIGIDDNFFKLGGHSLKAAAMMAVIHKAFNVKVLMHEVFDMPSIRKLGEYIKGAKKEKYLYIKKAPKKEFYPLSSAQKRLYILELMEGPSITYNMPFIYQLEEEPNRKRLEDAFLQLIASHENFRTSIEMIENQPAQKIYKQVNFNIEYCDLTSLPINRKGTTRRISKNPGKIEEVMRGYTRPFDLSLPPLIRAGVVKTGREKHFLIVDMHHIISDGISFERFKEELIDLYESKDLPPIRIQYKDYAEWQGKLDKKEVLKHREDFWLKVFQEEPPVLNLPLDYARPSIQGFEGDTIYFELNNEKTKSLKEVARKEGATLFMMLSGIVNILLTKLSGQEDIVLGTTVGGRGHKGLENIIGMFVNTLALRNYVYGDKSFIEFLPELKKKTLEAFENQEYPFEELVDLLKITRDTSRNPLFDVMLSLHVIESNRPDEIDKKRITLKPVRYRRTVSRFDMTFFAEETGGVLGVELEYCTKLFKEKTIRTFINYFKNIVTSVTVDPGKKISEIEILSGEERDQILYVFNASEVGYPSDKTIHECFEAQVEKTPDNMAVVFRTGQITYRVLDEKANQLAQVLKVKEVRPDKIVGMMVSRSIEMMVALLAVLKAGGAYVPIDPEYPIERIKFYLQDSNANILLTQPDIIKKFKESGTEIETIDIFDENNYSENNTRVEHITTPHHLAYVIYTSGSTGKPKGVMIRHRNAVNFFKGMTDQIDFSPGKIILALTTVSFDIFLLETLLPVTIGLKIVVADEKQQRDPQLLKEAIIRNAINLLQATPSRLRLLLSSSSDFDCLKGVKNILVGGEPFPNDLFESLKEHYRGNIIDVYGPTETTVWSTLKDLTNQEEITIGIPIANTQIYIVDKFMQLLPVGVVGELYIGGDGVARGYLNRPELTYGRFIENCIETPRNLDFPYKQIYQTGDLARWLPDGNIECLGRIDHQVKIRGFRIETGEIENHIKMQGDQPIKEAVVIAKEDTSGEKFLCAYIVSRQKIDIPELENTLSKTLLDYMIPSYFVQVDNIPLTPNGKVDRKKLPDPKVKNRGEGYTAPRNEIEEKLVGIWADILHLKKEVIGIDDHFFKIGGHSLKAALMISEIHKIFNVKLLMHEIFNMPAIREMGHYIKGARKEKYKSIEFAEKKEYYPQTSAQKRLYFIDQLENVNILYNLPMMDIYCKGIKKQKLEKTFQRLIKRHESLRTSFFALDGEAVQKIHDYETVISNFELQYYEATEEGLIYTSSPTPAPGKTNSLIAFTGIPFDGFPEVVELFIRPFDLGQPPLLRVGLIKILGNTQILMIDMHHIISDGTSMIILLKELWQLYDEEELPPLNVQYKNYAEWLNHETQKQEIKNQGPFWRSEFFGEIPILNLPFDYPVPTQSTFDGNTLYFEIEKEQMHRLKNAAQEQETNLYVILLALYNVLLAKLSGQEDIVVGTVTAGRNHADLHDIIGMFVKTLPIRNYPCPGKSVVEFLKEVNEKNIRTLENQDYPFEQLVNEVNINSNQAKTRHPLFNTVFGMQNEAERTDRYLLEVLMLDKSNPYLLKIKKSKFDMTLMGVETGYGLQFILQYNVRLFKEKTIERFINCYKKIVSLICSDINRKISQIDIISEEDKAKVLYIFNDTEAEYPKDKTFHELFEHQVRITPDNISVVGTAPWDDTKIEKKHMTYKELNTKANGLAHVLRSKGVRPDNIAGVMVEPSQEMLIAMLGILKAGGLFLPIDHKIPGYRVKYMLDESGVRFFLTRLQAIKDMDYEREIIPLDDTGIYSRDESNPEPVNRPYDLAYVIYTSGSTGKPKGVLCEHRTLINLCYWYNRYFYITSRDRVTKYASLGFDASVWEIFPHLLKGSSIYIVPEEIKLDINALNQYFKDNGITVSFLPTQMSEQFMSINNRSLRVLKTGGDKLKNFVKKHYRLYNCYGPTENTVCATAYPVKEFKRNIPIGGPIDNNQIYILDKNDYLQPIGVPGELCVGGDSVARGYLNKPELTIEKFVENPYPLTLPLMQSPLLYRTGDLARWLLDGNIEFLGRIDYQVKVRGFRIELGEIENQLLHIEDIKEAVVMAREDASGQKYLCAYIVPVGLMDTSSIKERLAKNLPDYMVPSYFVQIEKMPLNPSGKIDAKALPAPEVKGIEYAAPTNEIEKMLAEIWSEVLGMEQVGIDDNFFEIGGDSIKTVLISGRLQRRQSQVNVNEFFLNPTIRQLARHLKEKEPIVKKEVVSGNEEKIQNNINRDYEMYLEKVRNEKWPDFTVENDYKNVLLTGATGYLGAYLLYELLDKTSAALYLPVRGASLEEAEERLKKRLAFYFGSDFVNKHKDRMLIFQGDLRKNKLGTDDAHYEELSNTVETVVHSAANVKHYGLYEELYKDNVEGTGRLLEFALTGKKKDFHFISTMDTGRGEIPGKEHLLYTEYCHDEGQQPEHLYMKSKFEAEKQVLAYREKGLNASIYRAGNMTFHSETGLFQENIENNAFYAIMRGIIKVGFLSDNMKKLMFDMSFINYSARAIVLLLTRAKLANETYHISNPNRLSMKNMIEFLNASGIQIPDIKDGNIEEHLARFEGDREYEKIIERMKLDSWAWEEKPATLTVAKADRTVILLENIGFKWPKVNKQHIEKMIAHCKEVGFL